MTISMLLGFSQNNCSHTTKTQLTYCRQTYLLDIACFERAPKWALSMSRAILLCYFYKANEGLCKTYVMNTFCLQYFLNHTPLKSSVCAVRRICVTSTSTVFRCLNLLCVFFKTNIFILNYCQSHCGWMFYSPTWKTMIHLPLCLDNYRIQYFPKAKKNKL